MSHETYPTTAGSEGNDDVEMKQVIRSEDDPNAVVAPLAAFSTDNQQADDGLSDQTAEAKDDNTPQTDELILVRSESGSQGKQEGADVPDEVVSQEGKKLEVLPVASRADTMKGNARRSSIYSSKAMGASVFRGASTVLRLTVNNPFRLWCIKIVDTKQFDWFILFLIVVNTVTIALENPLIEYSKTEKTVFLVLEWIILGFFTLECLLKIVAQGFVWNGVDSYLRSGWNQLDFLIVIFGYLGTLPFISRGFGAIRLVRLLRPLKASSYIPGLRLLVNSLFKSFALMGDNAMLLGFSFVLFGTSGLHMFGGKFRQQCMYTDPATGMPNQLYEPADYRCRISNGADAVDPHFVCNSYLPDSNNYDDLTSPFNEAFQIAQNFTNSTAMYCSPQGTNPNNGVVHFDNIFSAWIVLLECISAEGWVDVTYVAFETTSYWSALFFILLMATVSFFVVELITGTVFSAYQETSKEEKRKLAEQLEKLKALQAKEDAELLAAQGDSADVKGKDGDTEKEFPPLLTVSARKALGAKTAKLRTVETVASDRADFDSWHPTPNNFTWANYYLATRPWFPIFIFYVIALNTLLLASEFFGQPQWWTDVLYISNIVITVIFAFEVIVKIIGLSWSAFIMSRWNLFDLVVIITSTLELIVAAGGNVDSVGLSSVRALRLLRVFKLAKEWKELNKLIITMYNSAFNLFYFFILLIFFIFVISILSVQLFAGELRDEDAPVYDDNTGAFIEYESSRANFDTLGWAIVQIYQIIGGENWNDICNDAIEHTGALGGIYFALVFMTGNFIILNLFLAILLGNFENDDDDEDDDSSEKAMMLVPASPSEVKHADDWGGEMAEADEERDVVLSIDPKLAVQARRQLPQHSSVSPEGTRMSKSARNAKRATMIVERTKSAKQKPVKLDGKALFIFGGDSGFRDSCATMVHHPMFDKVVLAFIILTSLILLVSLPIYTVKEDKGFCTFIYIFDLIATIVFLTEAVGKSVTLGFYWNGPKSYLRDGWNKLDFAIVLVAVINLVVAPLPQCGPNAAEASTIISTFKVFRVFRTLRPLRLISRVPSLQIVTSSMIAAAPALFNVILVATLFMIMFSVLGMNLFSGKFAWCEDENGAGLFGVGKDDCIANYEGIAVWKNPEIGHFDHIFASMLILFEVGTMEMWPQIMYRAVDVTDVNEGPVRDNSPGSAIFFVLFLSFINFLILNLFISVVVDKFQEMMSTIYNLDAESMLNKVEDFEKMWIPFDYKSPLTLQSQESIANKAVVPMDGNADHDKTTEPAAAPAAEIGCWMRYREWTFRVVQSQWFEHAILMIIALNTLTLMLWYADISEGYALALDYCNYFFSVCFFIEAVARISAWGRQYFLHKMNLFDLFVVILTIIEFIVFISRPNKRDDENAFDPTILRLVRLIKVVETGDFFATLRNLVLTVVMSMPHIASVGLLLALLFYIFAIMGISLFSNLEHNDFINVHNNFDTFGMTLFMLFRIATGESWNGIMHECLPRNDGPTMRPCDKEQYNCGTNLAYPYFVIFVILAQFLVLNLVVAVVLGQFDVLNAVKELREKQKQAAVDAEQLIQQEIPTTIAEKMESKSNE